jgi:hypothetical protein
MKPSLLKRLEELELKRHGNKIVILNPRTWGISDPAEREAAERANDARVAKARRDGLPIINIPPFRDYS